MKKTCFNHSGFTLLEILIVVTIIAIITASAAPSFHSFYVQTLQRDATRTVATVLRTAQNIAVLHRIQVQVKFNPKKNQYQIVPDPELYKDTKYLPRYARSHELPEGVIFTKLEFNTADKDDPISSIRTLNFYANGSSDGGHIELFSKKLGEYTIIDIKKTTGNVIVEVEPSSANK